MVAAESHRSAEGTLGRKPPVSVLGCGSTETPAHLAGVTPIALVHPPSPGSFGCSGLSNPFCPQATPPPDNIPKGLLENGLLSLDHVPGSVFSCSRYSQDDIFPTCSLLLTSLAL